jgi:hypothetical protein
MAEIKIQTWPSELVPRDVEFTPFQPTMDPGGGTVGGVDQVVASLSQRWKAKLSDFPMSARDGKILLWRGMQFFAEGRANVFRVGPYDRYINPLMRFATPAGGVSHAGGAMHAGGAGYYQIGAYSVALEGPTDKASQQIIMQFSRDDTPPKAGMFFELRTRLYGIALGGVERLASGRYRIDFWPPLRHDIIGSDVPNFHAPRTYMRFAEDEAANLTVRMGQHANPSIDLIEFIGEF